jgi:hypothetical protein
MYSVRTEYRNHDKSTYFRLKVQTFVSHTSMYQYVLSTYFLLILVLTFLHFERVHTGYMLTLVEYLLWVPDSIARQSASPAGLLASYFACELFRHRPTH